MGGLKLIRLVDSAKGSYGCMLRDANNLALAKIFADVGAFLLDLHFIYCNVRSASYNVG